MNDPEYTRIRGEVYAASIAEYRRMWGAEPSAHEDRRMWDRAKALAERDTL